MDALCERLRTEYGFKHDMGFTTRELETDWERENELRGHSEKLALVYALCHSEEGEEIVISNNLRTCGDCHNFMKLVSLMENRRLIVTDANRVHVFSSGQCSCGDFY